MFIILSDIIDLNFLSDRLPHQRFPLTRLPTRAAE
jgi:hypothetical protein